MPSLLEQVELACDLGDTVLATEKMRQLAGTVEAERLLALVHRMRRPAPAFLAPAPRDLDGGWVTSVVVSDDPPATPAMDPETVESLERVLDDVWRMIEGPGERPKVHVRLPWVEAIGERQTGPSVSAAAALAAVSHWSGVAPQASVFASGAVGQPIAYLPEKLGLFRRVKSAHRLEQMLGLGQGLVDQEEVRAFGNLQDLVRHAFGFLPVHARAKLTRLHVYVGARSEPRGSYAQHHELYLGESVSSEAVPDLCVQFTAKLAELGRAGHTRVEVSYAGPQALAAALGAASKNQGMELVLVDAEGARAWHSGQVRPAVERAPIGAGEVRVVVGKTEGSAIEGWQVDVWGPAVTPAVLPGRIASLEAWLRETSSVDLLFEAGAHVAFAIGHSLRNRYSFHIHHYRRGAAPERWASFVQGAG